MTTSSLNALQSNERLRKVRSSSALTPSFTSISEGEKNCLNKNEQLIGKTQEIKHLPKCFKSNKDDNSFGCDKNKSTVLLLALNSPSSDQFRAGSSRSCIKRRNTLESYYTGTGSCPPRVQERSYQHYWHETYGLQTNDSSPLNEIPRAPASHTIHFPSRTVFYFSLLTLLAATLSNLSVNGIFARMQPSSQKLAPAALSSLTEVLSPVLPFTGGFDLRRIGEYSLLHYLSNDMFDSCNKLYRIFTKNSRGIAYIPRGGNIEQAALTMNKYKPSNSKPDFTLSQSSSFIPSEKIVEMTMEDIAHIFKYAVEANRDGFDETAFFSNLSPSIVSIIRLMADAIQKSRGEGVAPAKTSVFEGETSVAGHGDFDILQFAAAMRIYAEWRCIRQVPQGYKGYAVGMNLGLKDVIQNVAKIEAAVALVIEQRRFTMYEQSLSEGENRTSKYKNIHSPTIREALLSEISSSMHKLPRLREKSAAMGLLWVRRQFQYSTSISNNFLQNSELSESVSKAYQEVYGKYHGWAVQKIFDYSFRSAPPIDEIFKFMNIAYYEKVNAKYLNMKNLVHEKNLKKKVAQDSKKDRSHATPKCKKRKDAKKDKNLNLIENAALHQENPFFRLFNFLRKKGENVAQKIEGEWEKLSCQVQDVLEKEASTGWGKFLNGVQQDWEKVLVVFANIVSKDKTKQKARDLTLVEYRSGIQGEAPEIIIKEEMARKAFEQIDTYLKVAVPLLEDISKTFKELNMDDPTRV